MTASATIYHADCRSMPEIADHSIDLVVTSPPYWHIKDYEESSQIGFGQTLHEYLRDLYRVWMECFRLLKPGSRLCINIGDQFARSIVYGRYKVIPLHAEVITQAERIGFDFLGSIIWQKRTTMNTTGGATIMGSFPFPPNGVVEIDYEYILIFKKPGKPRKISPEIKEQSRLTKEEWKEYFIGHWVFGGARQKDHEAVFPEELPRRLIRMFSFVDDTVLDPFMGSGTTAKVALDLNRNALGYEVNSAFIDLIKNRLGAGSDSSQLFPHHTQFIHPQRTIDIPPVDYEPNIQDAEPVLDEKLLKVGKDQSYKVIEITPTHDLVLDTGLKTRLLGINIEQNYEAREYLNKFVRGKKVILEYDTSLSTNNDEVAAYVYLKNRIFINGYMIKAGLATPDTTCGHRLSKRFQKFQSKGLTNGQRVGP